VRQERRPAHAFALQARRAGRKVVVVVVVVVGTCGGARCGPATGLQEGGVAAAVAAPVGGEEGAPEPKDQSEGAGHVQLEMQRGVWNHF